ncbi:hypothetical protein cyc_00646 [Cyclospora cayetanensis]|uniref:Protein kinase domain-containing protein n=1 Tax=Cyclospora cayetanensis TaxID=88456 RepID=A0A1D3CTK4_9EIME|nr:hypothetical protein cyc_00646 [Cyclospora cayetanensis]
MPSKASMSRNPRGPPPPKPGSGNLSSLIESLEAYDGIGLWQASSVCSRSKRYTRFVQYLVGKGRPLPCWMDKTLLSASLPKARSQKSPTSNSEDEDGGPLQTQSPRELWEPHLLPSHIASAAKTRLSLPLDGAASRIPLLRGPLTTETASECGGKSCSRKTGSKTHDICVCVVELECLDLRMRLFQLNEVQKDFDKLSEALQGPQMRRRSRLKKIRLREQRKKRQLSVLSALEGAFPNVALPRGVGRAPMIHQDTELDKTARGDWLVGLSLDASILGGPPLAPEGADAYILENLPPPQKEVHCHWKAARARIKEALFAAKEGQLAILDTPREDSGAESGESNAGKRKALGASQLPENAFSSLHGVELLPGTSKNSQVLQRVMLHLSLGAPQTLRVYIPMTMKRGRPPSATAIRINLTVMCKPAADSIGPWTSVAEGELTVSRPLQLGLVQLSSSHLVKLGPPTFAGAARVTICCGGILFASKKSTSRKATRAEIGAPPLHKGGTNLAVTPAWRENFSFEKEGLGHLAQQEGPLEQQQFAPQEQPLPLQQHQQTPRTRVHTPIRVIVYLNSEPQQTEKAQQQKEQEQQKGKAVTRDTGLSLGASEVRHEGQATSLQQLEGLLLSLKQDTSQLFWDGLLWTRKAGAWPSSLEELRTVLSPVKALRSDGRRSVHVVVLYATSPSTASPAIPASLVVPTALTGAVTKATPGGTECTHTGVFILESVLKRELVDPFAYVAALLKFSHISSGDSEIQTTQASQDTAAEPSRSHLAPIDSPLVVRLQAIYHDAQCLHILRDWLPPPSQKLSDMLPPNSSGVFNEAAARGLLQQVLQVLVLLQGQETRRACIQLTPDAIYLRGGGTIALALPKISRFYKRQPTSGSSLQALMYKPSFLCPLEGPMSNSAGVAREAPSWASTTVDAQLANWTNAFPVAYLAPEELQNQQAGDASLSASPGGPAVAAPAPSSVASAAPSAAETPLPADEPSPDGSGTVEPALSHAPAASGPVNAAAADMWRVGVLAFHLLSGSPPFVVTSRETLGVLLERRGMIGELLLSRLPHVSMDCWDFLAALFHLEPQKRLTAAEALEHPWIVSHAKKFTQK